MTERVEIAIEYDAECVTSDGTVLRADVYHPPGSGRHPVLLCRTPYDKSKGRVRGSRRRACRGRVLRARLISWCQWFPHEYSEANA